MANENTVSGFTITCVSCAARLKVNKPSLVGQMLACPKCGTMLKVTAPQEEKSSPANTVDRDQAAAPKDSLSDESSLPVKTALTTSDFDEIEQLLIKNPQLGTSESQVESQKFKPAPKPARVHSQASAESTAAMSVRTKSAGPAKPNSRSAESAMTKPSGAENARNQNDKGDVATASPLLPSDQWTSAASQKRKKMLSLLAAAIGLILVLLTVVIYLINSKSSPSEALAQNGNAGSAQIPSDKAEAPKPAEVQDAGSDQTSPKKTPPVQSEPKDRRDNSSGSPTDSKAGGSADQTSANDPGPDSMPSIEIGENETPAPGTEPDDQPPPLVNPSDQPPPVLENEPNPAGQPGSEPVDGQPSTTDDLPPFPKPDARANSGPDELNNGLSDLDRLSQMVDGSRLSVNRFRDLVASARDEQTVGLPKYFIEKNDPPPVDRVQQLAIPVSQLKYDSVPLPTAIRELMTITGIPITIDVESVIARHGNVHPKVQLDVSSVDFSQAIDQLLQSAELVKSLQENGRGLVVTTADRDAFSEAKFDLPGFNVSSAEDKQAALEELAVIVQGLIAPDSWKLAENPTRLAITESGVTVINSPTVQSQTRALLAKLNALQAINAADSASADSIADSMAALQTRTQRLEQKLDSPSGLEHRFPETLIDTLDRMSSKTDVTVLADWEALSRSGWGPLTKIPGTLVGSTLRDGLKELSQALGITYVIVDQHTIVLTSFEASVQRTDLEVYSFKKLLKSKINEEQALNVLTQTLAPELNNPLIRTYYSKRHQALFVVAPQILHRKISKIVAALEEM